jgi:pentatricopeptide repeat protein
MTSPTSDRPVILSLGSNGPSASAHTTIPPPSSSPFHHSQLHHATLPPPESLPPFLPGRRRPPAVTRDREGAARHAGRRQARPRRPRAQAQAPCRFFLHAAKPRRKPRTGPRAPGALVPAAASASDDAAPPAAQEERRPIRTPTDLAAAIRAAADADIDAAVALALDTPAAVPLLPYSLALLLRRLASHRSVAAARGLLQKLHPDPSSAPAPRGALLALADAVCRGGDPREIYRLLPVLADHGVRADAHLYNALVKAHAAGALEVLRRMERDGVEPDLVTYNTLVYALSRAGMVAKARAFLDTMAAQGHFPDVITYTLLMNGMCVQGDALGALRLLEEMEAKGCEPNERTYNTLLMGLCKNKKLDKAVEVYKSMVGAGMKMEAPAYATFARALCRSGSVADAYEVFDYAIETKSFSEVTAYSELENSLLLVLASPFI